MIEHAPCVLGPDNRRRLFDPSANPRRQSSFDQLDSWMRGTIMIHDAAVSKAREIASRVLAPAAGENDNAGRFSTEAVEPLVQLCLPALLLPAIPAHARLVPRTL